ncbi:hypothetical protein STRTUCAR8_07768, partial [Streptomyces turgidiscabies Car8]
EDGTGRGGGGDSLWPREPPRARTRARIRTRARRR